MLVSVVFLIFGIE